MSDRGGVPTARFCGLSGIPERTYWRWQAKARADLPAKGPGQRETPIVWPCTGLAGQHSPWDHRKVWAMARYAGHQVGVSTALRILDDEGLLLKADYERERRRLAHARKAACTAPPTGSSQSWRVEGSWTIRVG